MGSIIIAIDGYSSTGKSTIARKVADELGYVYIDTGAMYRGVTLYALRQGWLGPGERVDTEAIISHLDEIHLDFRQAGTSSDAATDPIESPGCELWLNGELVSDKIRTLEVSNYVSQVAAIRQVRRRLVALQQEMGRRKGIVMDGRDIGTAVFPEAELKIFLTASLEVRAIRRYDELKARGEQVELASVSDNLERRDFIDANRETDPLRPAADAVIFDNSGWTIEDQFTRIIDLARERIALATG